MTGMTRFTAATMVLATALLSPARAQNVATHTAVPAFEGQTKAPPPNPSSPPFRVETITNRLREPWSLAFLPDGTFLVTERDGVMRTVKPNGFVSPPIAGLPDIKVVAAQGLHDVLLDPNFAENRIIYLAYFAPPPGEPPGIWPTEHFYQQVWTRPLAERAAMNLGMERVARARLSADYQRVDHVEVILEGAERRLAIGPDGMLYVTGADRFRFYDSDLDGVERDFRETPDVRRNFSGRVSRLDIRGPIPTIPSDNPWVDRPTVASDLFAHGLRDPEGAAFHPETGELWTIDHGPQGGDEINIIRAGRDYGWPDVSYGVQYDARRTLAGCGAEFCADNRKDVPVGGVTATHREKGHEEPIYFWVPSIAPSGMMFYTGDLFPAWKGNLFVGSMVQRHLARLVLDGDRVVAEEKLLVDRDDRIRDVRQGPDGAVYLLTRGGGLWRLTPD